MHDNGCVIEGVNVFLVLDYSINPVWNIDRLVRRPLHRASVFSGPFIIDLPPTNRIDRPVPSLIQLTTGTNHRAHLPTCNLLPYTSRIPDVCCTWRKCLNAKSILKSFDSKKKNDFVFVILKQ
jgi:hypothetical protein